MNTSAPIILVITITAITSIIGFSNYDLRNRFLFNVGAILGPNKQWYRMISHALIHADIVHLIFNMLTFYFFAPIVNSAFGTWRFLGIYLMSIIGGGLLSLWKHRRNYGYSALGASGGVVGILFASIALNPLMQIGIMFIPVAIPGFIFGIVYLGYSVWGMQSQIGNISHEGHLGGATIGLLSAVLLAPQVLSINGLYIGIMVIPLIVLFVLMLKEK